MKNPCIKLFLVALLLTLPMMSAAVGATISGKVTEAGTNEVLPGANVTIQGTQLGAASGLNGAYQISNVPAGTHTLTASFMGYKTITREVTVQEGETVTENFVLESEVLLGKEVAILADRARDRKTPVAFSTVQKTEMEARLGSRDIPLIMNVTPSVYATPGGGGAGDSRINVRGFNQRNIAIMINGVPVNDMENGWVYWSNWDGLGDATASIQMQRGLSAVNLATPSIGGTMNVITDPSQQRAGAMYKQEFGNDGFLKSTFTAASGLINDKFAFNATVVRKTGDGIIDGTWTDAWAYYFGGSWQVNTTNRLELYALGAPQRHGQSLYMQNIGAYSHEYARELEDYDNAALEEFPEAESGRKYNENFNYLTGDYLTYGRQHWNGEIHERYSTEFINERENFYHKPIVNLNWYSQLSSRVNLFSTLYYSGGVGGGTGTYGSMAWDYSGPSRIVDWDATIERNKLNSDGARGILRNSVNKQWTVGLISKANIKATDALDFNVGLDWRTAEIEHYREVRDLLGGSYYRSSDSQFWPEDGLELGLGDKVAYDFTNTVDWIGGFAQGEYSMGRFTAYAMGGYSTIAYNHENFFLIGEDNNPLNVESGTIGGYQVKGGAQYNLTDKLDVYGNVGYVSKVPIFDNVISDRTGSKAENPENEKFTSFEFGVNYFSGMWTGKVSYYYTQWTDRANSRGVVLADRSEGIVFLTGLDQLHTGLEFEGAVQPVRWFRLDIAGSVGNWTYIDDVSGVYRDYDDPTAPEQEYNYYIKDLKVGDAPQTQLALGTSFYPVPDLFLQGVYRYYTNHYADFDPFSRNTPVDREQSWKTPSYGVLDFHASYKLPVNLGPINLSLFAHVFNALDEIYIQDAVDNSSYNAYRNDDGDIVNPHSADAAEVFLGLPRTFNVGLQFNY